MTEVVQERILRYADVLAEGAAVGDGVADDTSAIQTALDLGASVVILPPGTYKITNTLTVTASNLEISAYGATLVWGGAAGSPMLRFHNTFFSGVQGLSFTGDAANPPSGAISMYGTTGGGPSFTTIRDVLIGTIAATSGFTNGITYDGDNLNTDRNTFENVGIYGCTGNGVNCPITNATATTFRSCHIKNTAIAYYFSASATVEGAQCLNSSTSDFYVDSTADVTVRGYHSEGSARMVQQLSSGGFEMNGGRFSTSGITASGKFVDAAGDNTRTRTTLRNVTITAPSGYAGPTPTISVHGLNGAAHKILELDNVRGTVSSPTLAWNTSNLDVTPFNSTDEVVVYATMTDILNSTLYHYANKYLGTSTIPIWPTGFRPGIVGETALQTTDFALSGGWNGGGGSGASVTLASGSCDSGFRATILSGNGVPTANPTVTLTFKDGNWPQIPFIVVSRADIQAPAGGYWAVTTRNVGFMTIMFVGTPAASTSYILEGILMGHD